MANRPRIKLVATVSSCGLRDAFSNTFQLACKMAEASTADITQGEISIT